MAKVLMSFNTSNYSDNELYMKGESISKAMTGNATYESMAADVTELKSIVLEFGNILPQMLDSNKQLTLLKNNIRKRFEAKLSSMALRVQDISAGDEEKILSAGFDTKRRPTPIGVLPCPDKLYIEPGMQRGSLNISWNKVPRAVYYQLQYTEAPVTADSIWKDITSTKTRIVLDNLTRGQAYVIRIASAATALERIWSDDTISYVM